MKHPLDHDGDGKKGGSLPKRGRPPKVKIHEANEAENQAEARFEAETEASLKVLKANAIHDGEGGFFPVGHKFVPADDAAGAALKAKGLAE